MATVRVAVRAGRELPPTAKQTRAAENDAALGGMRRPDRTVERVPNAKAVGAAIRESLLGALRTRPNRTSRVKRRVGKEAHGSQADSLQASPIAALLRGEETSGHPDRLVGRARKLVADALAPWAHLDPSSAPKPGESVWADLVEAYCIAAEDPEQDLATWLREGAPTGLLHALEASGIFPAVDPRAKLENLESLTPDLAGWENYKSIEEAEEDVWQLLQEHLDLGFIEVFNTIEDAEAALGAPLVPSKLGLVTKLRADGSKKLRIVWDFRASHHNDAVRVGERIVLPRLEDVLDDVRHLAAWREPGDELIMLVLDIKDAFHHLPLKAEERRFHVALLGGRVVSYKRLVFGSKSSPTLWGRAAAWTGRSTAAVVDPTRARMELYVDDPLLTARGPRRVAVQEAEVASLWLQVIGYPLAWKKAAAGPAVEWIGAHIAISLDEDMVHVAIQEKKRVELLELLEHHLQQPTMSRRDLRSLAGKINFFAGLVVYLRGLLAWIWIALSRAGADDTAGSTICRPRGGRTLSRDRVHTRRVKAPLRCVKAFLEGGTGPVRRSVPLGPLPPAQASVTTDASPWGIGGVLHVAGEPVAWFAVQMLPGDAALFGSSEGEDVGISSAEALALLVAVRTWSAQGFHIFEVRSDSAVGLASVCKLKTKSRQILRVVLEATVDLAQGLYDIRTAWHVPGITNLEADALSRQWGPAPKPFPASLEGVPRATAADFRNPNFWKTTRSSRRRA